MRRYFSGSVLGLIASASIFLGCGPSYPKCDVDEDCHEGEYCVNGTCQLCRDDGDCPSGQACQNGQCAVVPGYCQSSGDCPDGQECQDNRCVQVASNVQPTQSGDLGAGPCQLQPVYFAYDSDALETSARNAAAANARCMRERGMKTVHMTGHTDPRGTEEYNLALGDRRARSVKEYVSSLGIEGVNVTSSSMGEEMSQGTDEGSWAADRRVDFQERQ